MSLYDEATGPRSPHLEAWEIDTERLITTAIERSPAKAEAAWEPPPAVTRRRDPIVLWVERLIYVRDRNRRRNEIAREISARVEAGLSCPHGYLYAHDHVLMCRRCHP